MKALLDFANMKSLGGAWSPQVKELGEIFKSAPTALQQKHGGSFVNLFSEELTQFCRKYDYYPLSNMGFNRVVSCIGRSFPEFVFLANDIELENLVNKCASEGKEYYFHTPKDAVYYPRVQLTLQEQQLAYRSFLNECSKGFFDIDFINNRLRLIRQNSNFSIEDVFFEKKGSMWNPSPIVTAYMSSIEDFIDFNSLVVPVLTGNGKLFSKVRECIYCHDFFVAKSNKAIFCSDKCRAWYHIKNKE